jgi:hypothetical protein
MAASVVDKLTEGDDSVGDGCQLMETEDPRSWINERPGSACLPFRGRLLAEALLLSSQLGRQRGSEIVRLEYLANLDL